MTLRARLAKLEARNQSKHDGPRVIIHNVVWRDDAGGLQSVAEYANVLTDSGWQIFNRRADEAEGDFNLRCEALAGCPPVLRDSI